MLTTTRVRVFYLTLDHITGDEELRVIYNFECSTDSNLPSGHGLLVPSREAPSREAPSPCLQTSATTPGPRRRLIMAVPPLRFDSLAGASWPTFYRRIRNHVSAKGNITDDQKRGILYDALDDPTLDRLERRLEPITLDAATYEQAHTVLAANMDSQLAPPVQYILFTARKQQPGESAASFADALSVLCATLSFENRAVRDKLCMYQFMAGVRLLLVGAAIRFGRAYLGQNRQPRPVARGDTQVGRGRAHGGRLQARCTG